MLVKWSYSSLKKFSTCARQYYEVKVKGNYSEPDTEATRYGKAVHAILEEYVEKDIPLPDNYQMYQRYLNMIKQIPGIKYPELKMAITSEKQPCDFEATDYWVRGIGDLIIVQDDRAIYIDYKTGSNKYPDTNQLKLMALMIFAHFPRINTVSAALLYLAKNDMIDEIYNRVDIDKLWFAFKPDLTRLEQSFKENYWPPNPSGLCRKHCVVLSCEHNGRN